MTKNRQTPATVAAPVGKAGETYGLQPTAVNQATRPSAILTLAARLNVDAGDVFLQSLKSVAFKSPDVTNAQLMALVLVANAYRLNPFTRELYAFPEKGGGIVPIVSVDGWYRIINEHPEFDGLDYVEGIDETRGIFGECTIYRRDRSRPTALREYLNEVRRNTDPWRQHEARMLRHKSIIQAARLAFGFSGIYDLDEGQRIIEAQRMERPAATAPQLGTERLAAALAPQPETQTVDVSTMDGKASIEVPVRADEPPPEDTDAAAEREALAADARRPVTDEDMPV